MNPNEHHSNTLLPPGTEPGAQALQEEEEEEKIMLSIATISGY